MVVTLGTRDSDSHENLRGRTSQRHRVCFIAKYKTDLRCSAGFAVRTDHASAHFVVRHVGGHRVVNVSQQLRASFFVAANPQHVCKKRAPAIGVSGVGHIKVD